MEDTLHIRDIKSSEDFAMICLYVICSYFFYVTYRVVANMSSVSFLGILSPEEEFMFYSYTQISFVFKADSDFYLFIIVNVPEIDCFRLLS